MRHQVLQLVIAVVAVTAFNTAARAQDITPQVHSWQWLHGPPAGTPASNDLVITPVYTASNNRESRFADWVAYVVTPGNILCDTDLNRVWRAAPDLEAAETLEPPDYKGAGKQGYDRGHQAPLASFACSRHSARTNHLLNITPQRGALNQGPWRMLEERVRKVALHPSSRHKVYVLTGPLYERKMPKLAKADEPHKVPSGYWKVVYLQHGKTLRVACFIMDQAARRKSRPADHASTLAEVERRSKLVLFPLLPTAQKKKLLRKKDYKWVINGKVVKKRTRRPR